MFFGLNLYGQKLDPIIDEPNFTDLQFPGGQDSMNSFFKRNIKPPEDFLDIQGTVYISVLIDSLGRLSDQRVFKGLNKDFNNEVLRVVLLMPNWIPGKIEEKPVNTKVILPIKFRRE
jgi:hypothetical protein